MIIVKTHVQSLLRYIMLVKKLTPYATIPTKGSAGAAGYDLTATDPVTIHPGERAIVSTGLAIRLPPGTYGRVAPRSGLAARHGIDVLAGVVDPDYRGEVKVILQNHGTETFVTGPGMRIAQLVLENFTTTTVEEVDDLGDDTLRGVAGFGSTGNTGNPPHGVLAPNTVPDFEDVINAIRNRMPPLPLDSSDTDICSDDDDVGLVDTPRYM